MSKDDPNYGMQCTTCLEREHECVCKPTTNFCPCCSGTMPGHMGYDPAYLGAVDHSLHVTSVWDPRAAEVRIAAMERALREVLRLSCGKPFDAAQACALIEQVARSALPNNQESVQ